MILSIAMPPFLQALRPHQWVKNLLVLVPLLAVPLVLLVTLLIQIPMNKSVITGLTSSNNRHSVLGESLRVHDESCAVIQNDLGR